MGEEGFPVRVSGQAFGVPSPPEPLAKGPPLQTLTTLEGFAAVPCREGIALFYASVLERILQ